MQHVHVDLPLEISLKCANTLHLLKSCFDMVRFRESRYMECCNMNGNSGK